jgi:hypothetical protein
MPIDFIYKFFFFKKGNERLLKYQVLLEALQQSVQQRYT